MRVKCQLGMDKEAFWKFAQALIGRYYVIHCRIFVRKCPTNCVALCIDHYDAILKSESFGEKAIPDTVIRFGAQPVSKPLSLFLKKVRPTTVIAVDESPEFRDPLGIVTHHIQSSRRSSFQVIVNKPRHLIRIMDRGK